MKKFVILVIFICTGINVMGEIAQIPFVPEEFDVDIFQYPYMVLIDNPKSEQLDTIYTFTDKSDSYQIRYTFFKLIDKSSSNIRAAYTFFLFPIIWNVAGREIGPNEISNYNNNDVKNEFNGDFGSTVFIQNPQSDFGEGYKYIMMNFYFKDGQGIVVQSILFNDLNIIQEEYFWVEVFHSFKFHE